MGAGEPRGAGGARERLARISHHFLSEPERTAVPAPSLLPVLLDDAAQDALVYGLAQTCHARGTVTRVLHVEPRLRAADPRSSPLYELAAPAALARRVEEELSGTKLPPDLCLIPLTDDAVPALADYTHVMLYVPATPEATLQAYLRIKRLLGANPDVAPGVVMLTGDNRDDSHALFDKLAAAGRRFLGCDPPLLGRLAGAARCRAPHGMLELADTLIRRGFAPAPRAPQTPTAGDAPRAAAAR
ncbi:MAG TPA: hypothetical protein VGA00_10810 [Acidiferrobacterales bacterium]|jgi:hypothetical protein